MRALVTGGTGFVGSNIVLGLLERGDEVLITGNDYEQKLPGFTGKLLHTGLLGIDWQKMGPVDVVFHEAAITNTLVTDRDEMMRANLESAKEVFTRAVEEGCRRIVYASSTAVYGNAPTPYREDGPLQPLNVYGESKKLLDEFAMSFANAHPGVIVVGLRYSNVYGPHEGHKGKMASMVYQLAQQMQAGEPKLFRAGEQKREYIYVKDVVRANFLAARAAKSCVVNCAYGTARTFNDVVAVLNTVLGTTRRPIYIDNPYEATYQMHTLCDMSRAKELIGFVPEYDLERGIADYFASGFLVPRR